jgi:hypothetical protein
MLLESLRYGKLLAGVILARIMILTTAFAALLVLIEPVWAACDLTVDASAAAAIATQLASGPVTLKTSTSGCTGPGQVNPNGGGDIIIAAPLVLSAQNVLTIDAYRAVVVNASISSSGTSLAIRYDDKGAGGTLFTGPHAQITLSAGGLNINGKKYTLIKNATALQNMSTTGYYALDADLTLKGKANFTPIGWTYQSNNENPTPFVGGL